MAPRKKVEGSRMSLLVDRLRNNSKLSSGLSHGMLASTLADNWRWIDFVDLRTGLPCLMFEYLFGCRGMLVGRSMLLEAEYAVGKTSTLFALYGMAQRTTGAYCAHFESENAPQTPDYIAGCGCDPSALFYAQPGSIESAMSDYEQFVIEMRKDDPVKSYPCMVGLDSVSGFGSGATMDYKESLDLSAAGALGVVAQRMSRWFSERGGVWLDEMGVFMVTTAQLKDRIDIKQTGTLTEERKQTIKAEKPLRYNATWRLSLTATPLRDPQTKEMIGDVVRMKMLKNKVSQKHKVVEIELWSGKGLNFVEPTCDFLRRNSPFHLPSGEKLVVEQRGAFIACPTLNDEKFESNHQGKLALMRLVLQNEALLMQLRECLKIRGFGFAFEKNYVPSVEEMEDIEGKGDE